MHAIISASNSVKNSKKLRKVLEIVLAFGNYMNSGKRGPAYGFRVQSLDTLVETKSSDKRMCLLHYIVDTIRNKFPELLNFDSELMYIEKASTGTYCLRIRCTCLMLLAHCFYRFAGNVKTADFVIRRLSVHTWMKVVVLWSTVMLKSNECFQKSRRMSKALFPRRVA